LTSYYYCYRCTVGFWCWHSRSCITQSFAPRTIFKLSCHPFEYDSFHTNRVIFKSSKYNMRYFNLMQNAKNIPSAMHRERMVFPDIALWTQKTRKFYNVNNIALMFFFIHIFMISLHLLMALCSSSNVCHIILFFEFNFYKKKSQYDCLSLFCKIMVSSHVKNKTNLVNYWIGSTWYFHYFNTNHLYPKTLCL